MKKRVSVIFLSFLLVVSLLQCYAAADKQMRVEDNVRDIEHEGSPLAVLSPSYWGGSGGDTVTAIVLEEPDIVYIAGSTVSDDFPVVNGYQEQSGGASDCFVMKLNATSKEIIYSTYIGGNATDQLTDIAVDSAGNVYATGSTTSFNFPSLSALQPQKYKKIEDRIDADCFVFKLSASGDEMLYSTFFGNLGDDVANSIDIDASGNAYFVGLKFGDEFQYNATGFDKTRELEEGYLVKLNSTGNGLEYLTYIGGAGSDEARSVAVDASGNAYVACITDSYDFPEIDGYDETYNGQLDSCLVKINATGTGAIYSTYLGGSGIDEVASIMVDNSGCVYATGYTSSSDLPTVNAYDDSLGGFMDCFVCKLSSDGQSLQYSTYIGGSGNDYGTGITVDSAGAAYMTGYTDSDDYPLVNARDSTFGGSTECIVSKLNVTTGALEYSTYLGGSGDDSGQGIAVNSNGDIFVAGNTNSEDFPTLEGSHSGDTDCFVIVILEPIPGGRLDIFMLLLIGAGAVAVIVVLVVFIKKK